MPVFRNVAHPGFNPVLDRAVRDILAVEQHLAAFRLRQSGQRIHQLCLAVAVNARHADNFAGAHLQREILHA